MRCITSQCVVCARVAVPPPSQGRDDRKAGEWSVAPDGPCTWSRYDVGASRSRVPFATGPARHEIRTRTTYCAKTNKVLDMLHDIASLKCRDESLPGKRPRPIWSVVVFGGTGCKTMPLKAGWTEVTPPPVALCRCRVCFGQNHWSATGWISHGLALTPSDDQVSPS